VHKNNNIITAIYKWFLLLSGNNLGRDSLTTYVISASHSKKFSSLIGPAIIPSGGFRVSSETCAK
jgi:hypothetical protein